MHTENAIITCSLAGVLTLVKIVSVVVATAFAGSLLMADVALAASKNSGSNMRDRMSDKQKKELRARAMAWCKKKFRDGSNSVERVQIQSNGKVICYIRGY
jgi:hypothetical protein